MQAFAIGLPRGWLACLAGRNPLVRGSDRLEALMILLTIIAVTVAVAVAGAIGTAVHETHSRNYAAEAKGRHTVTATAIQDSTARVGPNPYQMAATVRAHWWVAGTEHTETVGVQGAVKAGQAVPVWVDAAGDYTSAPASASQAVADAVGVAVLFWLGSATVAATAMALLRRWLDRIRFMKWENGFRELIADDGRKRGRQ